MKYFIAMLILLLMIACSSSDELSIDFEDEDTTVQEIEAFAEQMLDKKDYKLVDSAYNWIKIKDQNYYNTKLMLKVVELYGHQERFEKQMQFYESIFISDTLDNSSYVPHFYTQIGISYFRRIKIKSDEQVDSTTAQKALEYLNKAYNYELYNDSRMKAASRYYAGLTYAELGNAEKASEMYSIILSNFKNSKFHPKAYFKKEDPANSEDIVLTDEQKLLYSQTYGNAEITDESQEVKVNTVSESVEEKPTEKIEDSSDEEPVKLEEEKTEKDVKEDIKTEDTKAEDKASEAKPEDKPEPKEENKKEKTEEKKSGFQSVEEIEED